MRKVTLTYGNLKEMKMSKFKDEFVEERQNKNGHKYGQEILENFNPETDLVIWTIDNEFDQVVTFEHPEIVGRCPVSGSIDTYSAKFSFITDKHTMELKAFKIWLSSYYDKYVSHEYLAQEIFSIFWHKVQPKWLKVELYPAPRGNVTTTIVVEKTKEV